MDQVQREVLVTEEGSNISSVKYRSLINTAVMAGNEKEAQSHLGGLERFVKTHQSKAKAFREAWSIGKGTQVVRSDAGVWSVPDTRLSSKALAAHNGKVVNSPRLVEHIEVEADLLSAYAKEARAAITLKFKATPTQQGATNVQNVPQPHAGSANQAPAAQPQAPVAGSTEGRQGDTSGSTQGTGTPGVEAAGVTPRPHRHCLAGQAEPHVSSHATHGPTP